MNERFRGGRLRVKKRPERGCYDRVGRCEKDRPETGEYRGRDKPVCSFSVSTGFPGEELFEVDYKG